MNTKIPPASPRSGRSAFAQTVPYVLLLIIGCGLLFATIKTPLNTYDESLVLLNATRVMAGDVPYRDFWTLYAPGHYYLLAAAFRAFGVSILTARILDTVLRCVLVLEIAWIARCLTSRWIALIPFGLAVIWMGSIQFYSYPAFSALTFTLTAIICIRIYLRRSKTRWLILTGIAVGLTALTRLDFGAYAAISSAVTVLLSHVVQRAPSATPNPARRSKYGAPHLMDRIRKALTIEVILAATVCVTMLPYLVWTSKAGLATIWQDLVGFAAITFRDVRALPKPPPPHESSKADLGALWLVAALLPAHTDIRDSSSESNSTEHHAPATHNATAT